MGAGPSEGSIDPAGLDNILSAARSPRNFLGPLRGIDIDGVTIDEEQVTVRFCGTVESPVYGVVLEHVCHILGINERVVDANDFRLGMGQGGTKNQPPDPPKAIY